MPSREQVSYILLPAANGDATSMEDNSQREPSEAREQRGRLEREEKQSVQGHIAIKGTRNGLLLTMEPGTPFSELLGALADRLAEAPAFFRGASLAVDTSRRVLRVSERVQLEDLLAYYHMSVVALEQVTGQTGHTEAQTINQMAGQTGHTEAQTINQMAGQKEAKTTITLSHVDTPTVNTPEEIESTLRNPRESEDTLFLRRTVRSGQAIHHQSNVVILGDVNPGAEIVAGGDIIVWGVLRGMVHAGYPDNENALVCSLLLSPVQLRIAHLLSRPPEGFEAQPRPEVATIRQGQIVVETWVNGRPPRK